MVGTLALAMQHRRVALALLAVLAPALAGCTTSRSNDDSADRFQGEQRLVASTVEDFESAAARGDNDEICSKLLARVLVDRFTKVATTCAKGVDGAVKDADRTGLTVEAVRIVGPAATARVKVENGDDDRIQSIALVRQGGGWRIARFG